MSEDTFAPPPSGQGQQGALDRGNGFGINDNTLVPPFPPPPTRNNGSGRGGQPGYGYQKPGTEGERSVDDRLPFKPAGDDADNSSDSTLVGAPDPTGKLHLKTLPSGDQTMNTQGDNYRHLKPLSNIGEFKLSDLPGGSSDQSGRRVSIIGEYRLS
jgi:hypothetical protein